jgi:hypothetical protein
MSNRMPGAALGATAAAVVVTAALAASTQAASLGPSTKVSVTPGSGGPRTHFTFRFRVPVATGTFGLVIRRDTLSVTGPRAAGCVSNASAVLRTARKGSRARLSIAPGAPSRGGWCAGLWHGTVVQSEVGRCRPGPPIVCPDPLLAPRTIARFRFRVKPATTPAPPAPSQADVPTFAGLISAVTCPAPLPRPQFILPRPNSYTLVWKAATDPVTPSAQIVYDIFVATRPGGENYAQPSYTTAPGATSYTTPSTAPTGTLWFAVRARNAAGHEDQNTVERQGILCLPQPPVSADRTGL